MSGFLKLIALAIAVDANPCSELCKKHLGHKACNFGSYCKNNHACHKLMWTDAPGERICIHATPACAGATRAVRCSEAEKEKASNLAEPVVKSTPRRAPEVSTAKSVDPVMTSEPVDPKVTTIVHAGAAGKGPSVRAKTTHAVGDTLGRPAEERPKRVAFHSDASLVHVKEVTKLAASAIRGPSSGDPVQVEGIDFSALAAITAPRVWGPYPGTPSCAPGSTVLLESGGAVARFDLTGSSLSYPGTDTWGRKLRLRVINPEHAARNRAIVTRLSEELAVGFIRAVWAEADCDHWMLIQEEGEMISLTHSALRSLNTKGHGVALGRMMRIAEQVHSLGLISRDEDFLSLLVWNGADAESIRLKEFGKLKPFVDAAGWHLPVTSCKSTKRGRIDRTTKCRSRLVDIEDIAYAFGEGRHRDCILRFIADLGYTDDVDFDVFRGMMV
jgi:hypothetical protein